MLHTAEHITNNYIYSRSTSHIDNDDHNNAHGLSQQASGAWYPSQLPHILLHSITADHESSQGFVAVYKSSQGFVAGYESSQGFVAGYESSQGFVAGYESSQGFVAGLQGEQPAVERLLELHNMLTGCTTELRQPINLEQQLIQTTGSDSEVAASMVQLLQVLLL